MFVCSCLDVCVFVSRCFCVLDKTFVKVCSCLDVCDFCLDDCVFLSKYLCVVKMFLCICQNVCEGVFLPRCM